MTDIGYYQLLSIIGLSINYVWRTERPYAMFVVCPLCWDLPSESSLHGARIFLPLSLEDPSAMDKYNVLYVNWIQKRYRYRMIMRVF